MLKAALPLLLASLVLVHPETAVAQSSLRGSRASVDRIYSQALIHDLHFYESSTGVDRAVANGVFVRLTGNAHLQLAGVSYPYLLPTTHTFITRLAEQYHATCGEKLVVTSAVRPKSLRLVNGSDKTVHPTGMAVDVRKPPHARCLNWLRKTLVTLKDEGVLDAVEEHRPPHFHVAVFPTPYEKYARARGAVPSIASAEPPKPAAKSSAAAKPKASTPATTRYRVRKGDSLWTIARRHGITVDALKRANSIRSDRVVAGQVLVIPKRK